MSAEKSPPKVSVIIPNYNYERFLKGRIDSILNQTFKDFEIIFLDDCSTDQSVSFVKAHYSDVISKTHINSINTGSPFIQWNKGVSLASGEYIWIAEADDSCENDFLEKLLQLIETDSKIGIVYGLSIPIDEKDQIISTDFFFSYVADLDTDRWQKDFSAFGEEEVIKYLGKKNTITNVSGAIFRKKFYIQAGMAPENMKMCGDWLMYCRLLKNCNIAYTKSAINYHRQHPTKVTSNSVVNLVYFREFLQVQEYVYNNFLIPQITKKNLFKRFIGEWDRLTYSSYGRVRLLGGLQIAIMTYKYYHSPWNLIKIVQHLIKNSIKTLVYKWTRS